jgi:hypothetical protein
MDEKQKMKKIIQDGYTINAGLFKGNFKIVASLNGVNFIRKQKGFNFKAGVNDLFKDIYGY